MAGFIGGNVTAASSAGSFTQLRATSVAALATQQIINTKICIGSANNILLQLDSDASGTNTTYQSSLLTGIPNNWIDLGQVDPSRVWVRASTTTTTTVNWVCTW